MSVLSFSPNVTLCVMQTAEMNVLLMCGGIISPELRHHIKLGIYSAMRKQLRLVRRAQRDGSGGETPQMSFVSRRWKDALLTLFLFLFSQTAIMLSRNRIHSRWQSRALWSSYCSSVIIPNNLLLGGKSREKFSFGIAQRVTTGTLSQPRVIGVNLQDREKKNGSLHVITSVFTH